MAPKKANPLTEAEVAAMIARQMQAVIPTIVAQVTAGIRANTNVTQPTSSTPVTVNTPPPDTNVRPRVTTPLNTNNTRTNTGNDRNNPEPPRQDYAYKQFTSCKPIEFKGIEGPNGLVKWIEKTESVINISECPPDRIVKFATSMFLDHALMWWNTVVQIRGQDAINRMSWTELKALMLEHFCPKSEI